MRSDVFEKAAELKKAGVEFVLVTVAAAEGSSPGHPGTKMIVTSSEAIGTVGGGAMEAMAIDRARELLVERACDLKS
ncbi:XdhC family protein, partial [bacterium]|nr:XdhC family protein [bacterium]